jgi:hypothetical protein
LALVPLVVRQRTSAATARGWLARFAATWQEAAEREGFPVVGIRATTAR